MPPPRTFNKLRTTLPALRSHLVFTRGRLRRHPLTEAHSATFQGHISETDAVDAQAKVLADEADDAQVDVYVADDGLNELATKVSKAIEAISRDPNSPERKVFFGGKTVSDFIRPILGNQFTTMQQWPEALAKSAHKALQELAAEAKPLIEAATAAIARKAAADMAKKLFREVGERAKLFDKVNAGRKTLYGDLAALPHKHPALPASFADRFFRRDVVEDEVDEDEAEPTVDSVKVEIERLAQLLKAQEALLATLNAKADDEAKQALQRQADEARLLQIEKEESAKKKEKDEILARLGKK